MGSGIKVEDIMQRAVITVKKNDSVEKVVKIFATARIGGVVVTEDKKVVGILTEGDLIRDILAEGRDCKKTTVGEIMKHPVRTVEDSIEIEEASRIMRDLKIERLPVVKKDHLVGIITENDIIRVQPALTELVREQCELAKNLPSEKVSIEGDCENCGNYSENLKKQNGRYLCEECYQSE